MNQESLLLVAAFLTAVLGIAIGLIAFSYRQLIKKYFRLKEEQDQQARASQAEAGKIITQARQRSQELITQAEVFSEKMRQDFAQEISQAKKIQDRAYQSILKTIQSETANMLNNISNDITSQTSVQVQEFTTSLQKQILASQESVMAALKQDFQRVQAEIKAYQADMHQRIDDSVHQILASVSSKVLGKTLNIEDHEELILNALAQAKRENMF